ncbi:MULTISPECIES: hypothetical protein [Nocardia]|uniref:hypothetical protein n=1 Tax=Nocardia TaxID=1817 RepID=UPI000D68C22C|nr:MULTISPECIES: hypothetical protein [Nocardia]
MSSTRSRFTIKVFGIALLTLCWDSWPRYDMAEFVDTDYLDDERLTTAQEIELTEHGYAYSCPYCNELLVEGLHEPIDPAAEIELAVAHQCTGEPCG